MGAVVGRSGGRDGLTLMWALRCYHPPAAANAAIALFIAATMPVYAGAVALGAGLLFVAGQALDRADGASV